MNFIQRYLLKLHNSPKAVFSFVKNNADKTVPVNLCDYSEENSHIDRILLLSSAILDFNPDKDMRSNFLRDYMQEIYKYICSFWNTKDIVGAFEGTGSITFLDFDNLEKDAEDELREYITSRLILFKRLLKEYHSNNTDVIDAFYILATKNSLHAYRFDRREDIKWANDSIENVYGPQDEEPEYKQFIAVIKRLSDSSFNLVTVPTDTWITSNPQSESFHTEGRLPYLRISQNSNYKSFSNISGCVNIKCKHCNFSASDVPAFLHGAFDAHIGRQCPQCGEFCGEENHSEEYHMFGKATQDFVCSKCGYTIRRIEESIFKGNQNPIFCPKCESIDLEIITNYIT